jgi:hypothetical protein
MQYRWREFTLVRVPGGVSPLVSKNKFETAKHRQRTHLCVSLSKYRLSRVRTLMLQLMSTRLAKERT